MRAAKHRFRLPLRAHLVTAIAVAAGLLSGSLLLRCSLSSITPPTFRSAFPPSTFLASLPAAPGNASHGVPRIDPDYGKDVEEWWASHLFNPENPNGIAVGGILSPEPVLNVRRRFNGNVQAAIDALPAGGGTLFFESGTYVTNFDLVGRSNVHFVGQGDVVLKAGGRKLWTTTSSPWETIGNIAGCRQALESVGNSTGYAYFNRQVFHAHEPEHRASLRCVRDRAHNLYFKNLTFDGAQSAITGVIMRAVRDVVFDNVTFQNFVDPKQWHGGLLEGAAMMDNIWCRVCHFKGSQRYALYLDGLHGGGVINSRVEKAFGSGSLLFLTNDDFSQDYNENGTWEHDEIRSSAYVVVYGTSFADGLLSGVNGFHRSSLIKNNIVGSLGGAFVALNVKGSLRFPDLTYEYYGTTIVGNKIGDVNAVAAFSSHGASNPFHPHWPNRAQIGRYTIRDNVIEGSARFAALVVEDDAEGPVVGPNTVTNNCVNGALPGTGRPCLAPGAGRVAEAVGGP